MARGRRAFHRQEGERRYKKLFVIAVEGARTEPQYFKLFSDRESFVQVKCLKCHHKSAPGQVLKKMTEYLEEGSLKKSDEAWLVVDKDQWSDEQLAELHRWSRQLDKRGFARGFALSNPKFEYWLLLHFEDGGGVATSRECTERLKKHLPGYDKGIDIRLFTRERIDDAIGRARNRDNPPCDDWPRIAGTTVYKLAEKIREKR